MNSLLRDGLFFSLLLVSTEVFSQTDSVPLKSVPYGTSAPPPEWALLQRHLMDALYPAAMEFVDKYTLPDGRLKWRTEWPGMDGSDDGYESFYNFPLYYALGGPEEIDALSRKLWEGVTRQFTEYGQIVDEFDAGYDWMHHGEAYTNFYFFGLADPTDKKMRERALKFAALYFDDGTDSSNFDSSLKIIRSPLNGSLGPRMVNTAEDWVTHRPILSNYPLPYDDIPTVSSGKAWNDDEKFALILDALNERMMKGDVPLNLAATSLMLNAFMYTGDERYKTWVLDYVSAWMGRVEENGGIIPDNVGLSGQIGEHMNGNWWGGYYGWKWPHGVRNKLEATTIGASNAYLVSGDDRYLALPNSVIEAISKEGRIENGKKLLPHRYDQRGWYDFRPLQAMYPTHIWYMSRKKEDWDRVMELVDPNEMRELNYVKGKGEERNTATWIGYLAGEVPTYPVDILNATYREMQDRLERIRKDTTTPDQQDVHHWLNLNPVILEGLVQTMLGAPNHIYHGGLLHTSVRYFDPENKRSGIPSDMAALVEQITEAGVSLTLVNLHPTESRKVIVQGGMFGEHHIKRVNQIEVYPYQFDTVNHHFFQAELAPGAVVKLELEMTRFQNAPSYAFPWHGDKIPVTEKSYEE
ncbi:hypothetical protein [Cyclobacterium xiamenense]|uniref:hypothetical protein n=1 Tax=Cyclobacterium xiamenense TaxID=1297121 RepID=UPI0012B9D3C1|nr:hypothetical protein [Cyclobacterium xiamenense]